VPIPKPVTRFNRLVLNRVMSPLAARAPQFAVIRHTGRRSGRTYSTPVNIFEDGDGFVVALTYGRDVDWVRNVLAGDGCTVRHRGEEIRLTDPLLISEEEGMAAMPMPVRAALRMLNVTEFMRLDRTDRS
jgi:deazaflavin-dependent oxidoreductase (nitroreductase family)